MLPEDLVAFQRWPDPEARRTLARRLGLPCPPESQDWEGEVADPALLPRLLAVLEAEGVLSDDELYALMELVLAALERLPSAAIEKTAEWRRIEKALRDRPDLHATSIWSWSCLEDEGGEVEPFRLSPAMAEVWREVEPVLSSLLEEDVDGDEDDDPNDEDEEP